MALGKDVLELQSKISYKFKDVSYLDGAMTHSSYTNEMRTRGIKAESNERLEFLGDAVLQLVISEHVYACYSRYRDDIWRNPKASLLRLSRLNEVVKYYEEGSALLDKTVKESFIISL